jgi:hypothetical protein
MSYWLQDFVGPKCILNKVAEVVTFGNTFEKSNGLKMRENSSFRIASVILTDKSQFYQTFNYIFKNDVFIHK